MSNIQTFQDLHTTEDVLFLGNAWDVLSAMILEKAGFKAIGTTSWGIANSFGLSDGELIDFDQHLTIIKSIVEHVKIPVTADLESGYSENTDTIVQNVLRAADVGIAGFNIEDSYKNNRGLRDRISHSNLLSIIRTALDNHGFNDLFINARTDTYFLLNDPFSETITRAEAYIESGANGIFIPGLTNHEEIREIATRLSAPLNILSLPGVTNCQELLDLGVKRVSFGNALSDQVIAFIEENAARLVENRDTSHLYT